jgi:tryptophan-associated transmembrane protein
MNARARLAGALGLVLLGGAGALLVSGRAWQTVTVSRARPFTDEVVDVSGRTLEPAVAALGVVALAGVVAVLATRGVARRLVGVALAGAALAMAWPAVAGLRTVSAQRARSLVSDARTAAGLDPAHPPQVAAHLVWPVLTLLCALAVLAGGIAVALWGDRWLVMSARYEAPAPQPTHATLWSDLDRGHDPTSESG